MGDVRWLKLLPHRMHVSFRNDSRGSVVNFLETWHQSELGDVPWLKLLSHRMHVAFRNASRGSVANFLDSWHQSEVGDLPWLKLLPYRMHVTFRTFHWNPYCPPNAVRFESSADLRSILPFRIEMFSEVYERAIGTTIHNLTT